MIWMGLIRRSDDRTRSFMRVLSEEQWIEENKERVKEALSYDSGWKLERTSCIVLTSMFSWRSKVS